MKDMTTRIVFPSSTFYDKWKTSFILHACYRRNIFWYLRQNVWQLDGEIILSLLYDHPPIILIATDARDFQAARLIFLCLNQSKKNHPSFFSLGFARVSKDFKQHQLRGLNWAKTLESLPLKLKKNYSDLSQKWGLKINQETGTTSKHDLGSP